MEECIICFDETIQFVFFPCAHKVCTQCYKRLVRCPICNYDPEIQQRTIQLVRTPQIQTSNTCSRISALFVLTFVSYMVYHTVTQYVL